jgi:hypothetical protein
MSLFDRLTERINLAKKREIFLLARIIPVKSEWGWEGC